MGTSQMKPKGWWSRRHQTEQPQREATARYLQEHGRVARQRKAKERLELRRTASSQSTSKE